MSLNISNCEGINCPLKDACKRNEYFRRIGNNGVRRFDKYESFISAEFKIENGKFECNNFLGKEIDVIKYNLKRNSRLV